MGHPTKTMKELYKEFVKAEAACKAAEEKKDALRAAIVAEMQKNKVTKEETDFGTFTVAVKTNWKYTEKVAKLKEAVKLQEVKEQNSGKATPSQTHYLRYTAPSSDIK